MNGNRVDIATRAAEFVRSMDLASRCSVRKNWEERTDDEKRDWWTMQNAVDGFTQATYNPDKPGR